MKKFDENFKKVFNEYEEVNKIEVVPLNLYPNGVKKYKSCYLPNYCRDMQRIKNSVVRDDDVFVIGFPKTGTTWVEEIVWLIQNNINIEKANDLHHFMRVLFIDIRFEYDLGDFAPSPRTVKCHLLPECLPDDFNKKAKVIYVVRNPKDTVVSYYNFYKLFKMNPLEATFKELQKAFLEGEVLYGSWCNHVNIYTQLPNVKIIHYEDLIEKPHEKIKELAQFIGKDLSDEQLNQIIAHTTFEKMKNNPAIDFKNLTQFGFVSEAIEYFKKGQVGNWYSYFTEKESKQFDEEIKKRLKYQGPFKYGAEQPFKNNEDPI